MRDVQFTLYDETRFASHLPFGPRGYLFTISANFPEETPAHTKVTDWEMAVYRKDGDWEVRDVNGNRRVWGVGSTRAEAVDAAFAVVYRERMRQAAQVADKRRAAGLEPVPPYQVEVTSSVTLVIAPGGIAILNRIEAAEDDGPASYHVLDADGGQPYVIRADDGVTLRTTAIGVLHERCGHTPEDAARFENEAGALIYAQRGLAACWPCHLVPQD
ncbi:hypothetical protein [Streptomyces sp. Root369]|uniref:hypothetical protein n=1 Tax=Streptomyces sp. Root369 TaxID=1736523 RepID=UPI00070BAC22|nr:hypothetical protein [Streptomyces sp. Root369]KQW13536.1 hypothetical protein ASD08_30680 [Streptomyces sp. Root369]